MPYTPPTQRSPASSNPSSPVLSRNHSYAAEPHQQPQHHTQYHHAGVTLHSSRRPALPRSASSLSYLNKHRRTPSLQQQQQQQQQQNDNRTHQHAKTAVTSPVSEPRKRDGASTNGSIRQPPAPVNNLLIPPGAITTPPDSSSDDEDRGRQLGNLAELQEALQSIELKRQHSPIRREHGTASAPVTAMSPTSPEEAPAPAPAPVVRPTLTPEARRISHSRSNSDISLATHAKVALADSPIQTSEEDSEEDCLKIKPPLLRKKSGELVKPALRGPYRRRPSSAPGTPTFKNVHFNEELTSIRHFRDSERPIAVSAGSSPVETYDSESEYPFSEDRYPPARQVSWEIRLANFPTDTFERKSMTVRVERIFLSNDSQMLIGTVAAANIAFHKLVVARFTLDYWKTTSEVVAEYNNDVRKKQINDGYDRFNFTIKLADLAHLESKTMLLCVRYQVNGQEFWDNNNHMNYQVDFIKKVVAKPARGGKQVQTAGTVGAIPRSRHTPVSARPRSYPNVDDDFSDGFESGRYPPIRLRTKPKSAPSFAAPSDRRPSSSSSSTPGGVQALANRYDFSASLNAALSNAQAALGDQSGLLKAPKLRTPVVPKPTVNTTMLGPRPGAISSEKHDLESAEYNELIQKYCFYGSTGKSEKRTKPTTTLTTTKPSSPPRGSTLHPNPTTTTTHSAKVVTIVADSDSGSASGSLDNSGSNSPLATMGSYASATDGAADHKSPIYLSRATSPGPLTGSDLNRTHSPMKFGFPYNHNVTRGIFVESQAPQATCG